MKILPALCLLASLCSSAQKNNSGLQSLVEAERSFSKYSETKSLREAFINFFAPNSILIEEGKEVNGLEHYKKQPPDSVLLIWDPVYADIAASEDFGYTTGPFKFFKSRQDTTLLASGYYSSVWEKQATGEWKVVFDLGSGSVEPVVPVLHFSNTPPVKAALAADKIKALSDMLNQDKRYIEKLNAVNKTADPASFSDEGRIHRNRFTPFIGKMAVQSFTDPPERNYKFTQLSGRMATSGDLGFTYGTVELTLKVNGENKILNVRYFRIWKKEEGKPWKIVLDVIA